MKIYTNKLINKAIRHYKYNKKIECENNFNRRYDFWTKKDNLKNYTYVIWGVLGGIPNSTHIAAKNYLYQENDICWKYFERAALFWTMSHINNPWIDHIKDAFEYCLYVEREDLLEILFSKTEEYLNREDYKTNKDYIKQKVYPSNQLVQFLIEKWLGKNPVKDKILQFGSGYGIYQLLIDNWDDFSKIDSGYWDELCEYHLNGIGLQRGEKRENEEFLGSGLIPMELINMIKVRKKLGLDIPKIEHELFRTPMAKEPKIPTVYNENLDVKFQLIKLTIENKKKFTYDEIIIDKKRTDLFL